MHRADRLAVEPCLRKLAALCVFEIGRVLRCGPEAVAQAGFVLIAWFPLIGIFRNYNS